MAYLAKGRRQDLLELAETLDISIPDNFKFLDIKDAVVKVKDLFERQLTFLKVPVPQWVVYLVGLLPTEVSNLIAKESVVHAQDYYKVKQILLKRFKLSAEKFRQMFSRHAKDPVKTWRDFYFDLQTYFDGWLKESKVTTLEELKDLIVADQIKKKAPQDYKDHFLDQWSSRPPGRAPHFEKHWCNWNNLLQFVDKLDSYEEVRNMRNKNNKNFSRKQKEMESNPWRNNYTRNPKLLSHEHSLSGFPVKVGGKPGFPVTVGRIQFQMKEYLRRKLWIQKKTELLYLVMDVVLPESFDQDATLATQFDKKIPCHQV
ncbi:uncharacterized protein TNCV_2170431 [Trichonephila clavipes]|nr:uncharacterized protein TNCV_2170431 [Trichonephila clavipes]